MFAHNAASTPYACPSRTQATKILFGSNSVLPGVNSLLRVGTPKQYDECAESLSSQYGKK